MSEKKSIYKRTTIGVAALSAVLLIALAYSVITYNSMLQGKDSEIQYWKENAISGSSDRNELQAQVDDLERENARLQSDLDQKNAEIVDLNKIINLQESSVWVNDETVNNTPNSYTYWKPSASYAGYVVVNVETSTTSNTYARVIYNSHGVDYDESITVGSSGNAVFPILPGTIEVRVGNTNLLNGATETVTVTYYY